MNGDIVEINLIFDDTNKKNNLEHFVTVLQLQ